MQYRLTRDGKTYGPYTEAELRAYFEAGNIAANDLVRSEEMTDWKPLRKVLPKLKKNKQPKPKKDPLSKLNPAGLRADVPSPPDMPWWLALMLDVFTSLTFFVAWDFVEAVWLRRVQPRSRGVIYCGLAGLLLIIEARTIYATVTHGLLSNVWSRSAAEGSVLLTVLALRIAGRFSMRASLLHHYNHVEPVGLQLSKFMTLLFGGLYFQFHFNRINELKRRLAAGIPPV